jgi:hypothetical protein
MSDIYDVIDILSALRDLVGTEPGLSSFIPAADAVLEQAEAIARGEVDIPLLRITDNVPIGRNVPNIPTQDLARALRVTFDKLPSIDDKGDRQLAKAYATLLRNAEVSILHAIFTQYPEILPKG